jgi:hypothetical protein
LRIYESEGVVQEGRGGDLVFDGRWWAAFGWLSSFKTLLCSASSSLSLLFLLLFCPLHFLFHPVLVHHLENNVIIAGRPSVVNLEQK